jgi:hypothetical protein
MKTVKLFIILLFISLSVSTYSAGVLDGVVSIEDIYKNPEKYKNKEIKIKGTVTKSASLFMRSGFIVKDKTGEIFVVVSGKLPPKIDDVASLKGSIIIVGSINDKTLVYFKENKPKEKE